MRCRVVLGLVLLGLGAVGGSGQELEEGAREKSLEGVKVRLLAVRWGSSADVATERTSAPERGLLVKYDVSGPPKQALPSVECVTPDGRSISTGPLIVRGGAQQTAFWSNFDPRQKSAVLRFAWLPAEAPRGADGRFEEILKFPEVPLPKGPDVVTPLNLEASTRLGFRVMLEKIALQPKRGNGGQVAVVMRWFPPAEHLDCSASVLPFLAGTTDDRGTEFESPGWSSSDELAPPEERIRPRFPRETVTFSGLPSPRARTLSLALKIQGSGPRLERWYRRLDFPVSLAALPLPPKGPAVSTLSAQSKGFRGEIERNSSNFAGPRGFLLWVRPAAGAAAQEVVLEDRTIRDERGLLYPVVPHPWPPHWRANGTPALPGDLGQAFSLGSRSIPPGTRLTLSATVRAIRTRVRPFSLKDVPVPALGKTLNVDRSVRDASGGRLTLARVVHFDEKSPPAGWEEGFGNLRLPRGLVFVFEYSPPEQERGGRVTFGRSEIRDERDERLVERLQRSAPAAGPNSGVMVLTPPARPGAERVSVRLRVEDVLPVGEAETLEFKDILAR